MMALISDACVGNIDGIDDDDDFSFVVVYLEDEDNYVVVAYLDGRVDKFVVVYLVVVVVVVEANMLALICGQAHYPYHHNGSHEHRHIR